MYYTANPSNADIILGPPYIIYGTTVSHACPEYGGVRIVSRATPTSRETSVRIPAKFLVALGTATHIIVWRSQPLAKNVRSGTDSVLDLFTWNADVMI